MKTRPKFDHIRIMDKDEILIINEELNMIS